MAGLSVATNVLALRAQQGVFAAQFGLAQASQQLATGLRINTPTDGPAAFVIATNLQTRTKSLDTAVTSIADSTNAISTAGGAIDSLITIVQRIRTLAIEASSSLLSPTDVQNVQAEITALRAQFNDISANTEFNGLHLLSGTPEQLEPTIVQQAATVFDSGGATTLTTSISASLGAQPADGDVLIAALTHGDGYGAGGGTATISAPSGWTEIQDQDNNFDNGLAIYEKTVTGAEPASYTWNVTTARPGNTLGLIIDDIQGANSTAPVAAVQSDYQPFVGGLPPLVTPVITANNDNELALAFFAPNEDFGGNATTPGWNIISNVYQQYNEAVEESTALTKTGEALQAGYQSNTGTEGNATILTLSPGFVVAPVQLTASTGPNEGETDTSAIAPLTANLLGLSNIDVTTDPTNAITISDEALDLLTQQQAELGSTSTILNYQAQNNQLDAVNETAAYSNVRDADVATAAGNYTKNALLQSYGLALLAHANVQAASILQLFQ